ncbi:VOC family protein [Micromonospora sp. CB01531]|uniref:VOC family protein n=1 Tax=Micromonospora sp. CB01531 TaxID=1718947 RepID=UPI00093CD2A6|nr:glyoxalase [Micromonospora sp. CB01531]OKI54665.1 glyoxalase [Micromonospora sp. CB01531]
MDMKLEAVVVPVSDQRLGHDVLDRLPGIVDKAKQCYGAMRWRLDADFDTDEDLGVVQLTPRGSQRSVFGTGVKSATPGSAQGLHLVVTDIEAARAELVGRGAEVSEVFHDAGGVFHHAGMDGRVPGPDSERRSYGSFALFGDPDGNGRVFQKVTTRCPGW